MQEGMNFGEFKDSNEKIDSGNTAPQVWSKNGLIGVQFNPSGGVGSGSYENKQKAQQPMD